MIIPKYKLLVIDQGGVLFTQRPASTFAEVLRNNPNISDKELKAEIGTYGIEQEMLDFLWEVHRKGTKLSYLSNGSDKALLKLSALGILPPFTNGIASDNCDLSKPDPKIYKLFNEEVLQTNGIRPEEALFVDDREYNLKGFEDIGGNIHLFNSIDELKVSIFNNN